MSGKVPEKRPGYLRNADPTKLSVAQFLDLAEAANVMFSMVDGRLVMRSARVNWRLWQPLRHCLDEIGVEAIADYFRQTTPQDRAILSAAA